ncbi:hypothetical protein GCM10010129_04050 [Streptomyces fumigatiscleroticus]|nr:hypothetical protein GCM10010129_04050 [Streptomyces fumigatiscleroticus]
MDATLYQAAAAGSVFGVIALLAGGVVVAGALVWAIRAGIEVRRREPAPPRRGAHPTLPESGPADETRQRREPAEVRPAEDGERLTPHRLRPSATTRGDDQRRPRWDAGTSGSFGSGGPGGR